MSTGELEIRPSAQSELLVSSRFLGRAFRKKAAGECRTISNMEKLDLLLVAEQPEMNFY